MRRISSRSFRVFEARLRVGRPPGQGVLRGAWVMLACALALSGCAHAPTATTPAPQPQPAPPPVNLSGYSAGFKEGFSDGCSSARGRVQRDPSRFQSDGQYAQGWQDGQAICARR